MNILDELTHITRPIRERRTIVRIPADKWAEAFDAMANHPSVKELYGAPLCTDKVDEPHFLFRNHVICKA